MDAEDFRWITDLGTDEFHGAAALELISPDSEEAMGVSLQPLIYIKAGIFYAMQKSEKEFNKENFGKGTDPERLGHIADTMAADIFFDAADSQLIIRNGGDNPPPQVVLTNTPETKYYISLKNIRHRQSTDDVAGSIHAMAAMAPPPPQVGSDFRHYYLVIKDPQGNKFDLSFADGAPKVPQNCDSTHVSSLPNLDPPA
jgi:hypothetical protein